MDTNRMLQRAIRRFIFAATPVIALTLLAMMAYGHAATPQPYAFKTVDVPFTTARDTQPHGINHAGGLVGEYFDNGASELLGFRRRNGVTTMLPAISPQGLNHSGYMTGWYRSFEGFPRGFLHTGEQFLPLYPPDSSESQGLGINDAHDVVGNYRSTTDGGRYHAFVYRHATGTYATMDPPYGSWSEAGLTAINNLGTMVGHYDDHGYGVDASGTFVQIDVPGATWTLPRGLNDDHTVVGTYAVDEGFVQGFVLKGGVYTTLHYPGAVETYPQDVNNKGVIAGYYWDSEAIYHGFTATPRK